MEPIEFDPQTLHQLEDLFRQELGLLGENPQREGLLKTPTRVAKAMLTLTQGYQLDPMAVLQSAKFKEDYRPLSCIHGQREHTEA